VKVSFELSAKDVEYLRGRLRLAREGERARDEDTVRRLTRELIEEALATEPPEFVRVRLTTLARLLEVLEDQDWRIEGRDRARILDALVYFADPDDMISDRTPGLGYLDDAIMIELVAQELKHDLQAYEDFCQIRRKRKDGEEAADLETPRQSLLARMRRRRRRDREQQRGRPRSGRSPIGLW
jgi:uncharacterized membrane protein YkvA (DUF1232 family)